METTCVHYSQDYVGTPCIVAIDRDHCAVADGTGNLTAINVRSQEVGPRLFVGIVGGTASSLRSLRRHPAHPGIVAVATRAAYAAIADIDRQAVAKIHPVQGGTVQAVAISPDGRSLAIGTGAYSVSGPPQTVHVELWDLSDEDGPRYLGFAAMPGVCADAVAWSPDGGLIACASGLRSQKIGFVAQLEAADLRRGRSSRRPGPARPGWATLTAIPRPATWPSPQRGGSGCWAPLTARRPGGSIGPCRPTSPWSSTSCRRSGRSS